MPRTPSGWWDKRSGRYYARLGETNPKTGKARAVMLEDDGGRPVPKGDRAGVAGAIRRLLAGRQAARRTAAGPTVAEVCGAFVQWHADNGSAEATIETHRFHLRRFYRFAPEGRPYADRPAASIGPEDVWRFEDSGIGSVRLAYASILACWNWASRPVKGRTPIRYLDANPLAKMKKPARGKVVRKRVPWDATRQLLRFAWRRAGTVATTRRDRTRAAERLRVLCLAFLVETGCRPGEAAALEWSDLDLDAAFNVIPSERTKTRKTGRDRRFAVSRWLARVLRRVRAWEGSHPKWVFVPAWTRAGKPTARALGRWWREGLRPAALAAGIPIPAGMTNYWHRHEWQSLALESNSVEAVAAAAGNSPRVLIDTYHHGADDAARDVAESVARSRRGRRKG